MTHAFRNFLKIGQFNNFKNTNEPICFWSDKPGHMKNDCPFYKGKYNRVQEERL